jgi:hypothetical protein
MLKIACLPTHPDRSVQIEREFVRVSGISFRLGLDELVKAIHIFELGVGVEEEGGVVGVGDAEGVEFLEVRDEIVYPLRI